MSPFEGIDWQLDCGQIRQRGAHLLATEQWSDCSFLLGLDAVPVKAHKLILAMASPVFQAMFYGPIAERSGPIPIPDIQPDVFRKVLQYVYTDDIDLDNYITGFELYYAAQKYMLPHLQTVCTAYLSGNLVPQNACRIYEFAELIGVKELEAESLEMLKAETKLALSDSSFEELALDTVIKIFSMDDINIDSELVLLAAAERYYLAVQKGSNEGWKNKYLSTLFLNTHFHPENDSVININKDNNNYDEVINNANNDDIVSENRKKENLQYKKICIVNDEEQNIYDCYDCELFSVDDEPNTKNIENITENRNDEVICSANNNEIVSKNPSEEIVQDNNNSTQNNEEPTCSNSGESLYNEIKQNEEDKETEKQDLVHKLIKPIRFLTLTVEELAEYKPKSSLLTALDILALMMNIASKKTYMPLPNGFSTCRECRCS